MDNEAGPSRNVPPFITTLTGNFLARGICSLISRESISINHPMIDALAGFKITLYHMVDGEWVKIKPIAFINFNVILFVLGVILIVLDEALNALAALNGTVQVKQYV